MCSCSLRHATVAMDSKYDVYSGVSAQHALNTQTAPQLHPSKRFTFQPRVTTIRTNGIQVPRRACPEVQFTRRIVRHVPAIGRILSSHKGQTLSNARPGRITELKFKEGTHRGCAMDF